MIAAASNREGHHSKAGDSVATGDAGNLSAATVVITSPLVTTRVIKPNVRANRSLRSTDVTGDVVTSGDRGRAVRKSRAREMATAMGPAYAPGSKKEGGDDREKHQKPLCIRHKYPVLTLLFRDNSKTSTGIRK
jgi:hypothetical protein